MAGTKYLGQLITRSAIHSKSSGARHIRISQIPKQGDYWQEQIQEVHRRYKSTRSTSQPEDTRPRNVEVNMSKADTAATGQGRDHIHLILAGDDAPPHHHRRDSGQVLPFPDKRRGASDVEGASHIPIRFLRSEKDSDHEKRIANAESNEMEQGTTKLGTTVSDTINSGILDQVPSVTIRRPLTDGPDLFMHNVRGTGMSSPVICEDVAEIRARRHSVKMRGGTIGFVPTMGALHQGHLDLMKAAARRCSEVWISIYVNPTQFGANEDLSTYPSTWQADLDKIEELNDLLLFSGQGRISTIFRPRTPEVLYPYGIEGTSHVLINPELTQILEGSSRPTFFRGVTTVVMKLLNIVQPEWTFFGQKDFQQFAIIKRMIKEFHLPVFLERVSTTREPSGLAMSSRNAYLGQRRLRVAPLLHNMLSAARQTFRSAPPSERTRGLLLESAMKVYTAELENQQRNALNKPERAVQFRLDYLSLADPDTLQEIRDKVGPKGAVMSLAIVFNPLDQESIGDTELLGINGDKTTVRLIDNILLDDEDKVDSAIHEDRKTSSDLQQGLRLTSRSQVVDKRGESSSKRQNNRQWNT